MPATRSSLPLALLVAAAAALSVLAAANDRLPGDLWLARRIQDLPGWLEPLFEAMRWLTETWRIIAIGLAAAALLCIRHHRIQWLVLSAILLLTPLLQALLKDLVERSRPDPSLIERRAGFSSESFPSGHVMSGTVVLLVVGWLLARRLKAGWPRSIVWTAVAALSVLNGAANVYEGVHWPSDVFGGYAWALALFALALALVRRSNPSLKEIGP